VNEIHCSEKHGSPAHEWWVIGQVHHTYADDYGDGPLSDLGPSLLLRCDCCGAVGMATNPSPPEMRRARKPHRWFAHHRIRLIGRPGEIDRTLEEKP